MHAVQHRAAHLVAAGFGDHPGPVLPRRIVENVLSVTTLEVGDPVPLLVGMESNDSAWNAAAGRQRTELL